MTTTPPQPPPSGDETTPGVVFECAWRHPECETGPGPGHFRHVPYWEAVAMPDTPDHYLENIWAGDRRTYLALAARSPRSTALRDRVVHLACAGPGTRDGDDLEVTAEQWLVAALSGQDLTSENLRQIAAGTFTFATDNPPEVVIALLGHPAFGHEAVAELLHDVEYIRRVAPEIRAEVLGMLDAAGWPATLVADATSGRHQVRGAARPVRPDLPGPAGMPDLAVVLEAVLADPDLAPVLERLAPHLSGSCADLIVAVRAVRHGSFFEV